ncbi:MAG: S49 family peptidase [Candidatus Pacebacteria bacterium]|nr:S49 family peptidase [Candidatus Paceibacterota bacterium]
MQFVTSVWNILSSFVVQHPIITLLLAAVCALFVRAQLRKRSASAKKEDKVLKPDKVRTANSIYEIRINGPILTTKGGLPSMGGAFTVGSAVGALLNEVAANEKIAGVILYWNTPGGTPVGAEYIRQGILACKAAGKKVMSHGLDLVASGGVWGIGESDFISTEHETLYGSIGVIGPQILRYEEVSSLGSGLFGQTVTGRISAQVLYAGKGKAFGSPFVPADEGDIGNFQAVLDRTYARFCAVVCEGRDISSDVLEGLGARVVDAAQAKELGLIDDMMHASQVRPKMLSLLGKSEKDCSFVKAPERSPGLFSRFMGVAAQTDTVQSMVRAELRTTPALVVLPSYLQGH